MSRVDDSLIENAWKDVSEASSSPDELAGLMERFGETEPAVVDFLSEASQNWGEDATDLAFHGALVIWLSFARSGARSGIVTAESLVQHFQANLQWLEQQQGEAILIQKKLSDVSRFAEPDLMRYAVELIFEAHEDGLEVEPEEQEELLLVLKSLIDAFSA